jgi:hypothetical protein
MDIPNTGEKWFGKGYDTESSVRLYGLVIAPSKSGLTDGEWDVKLWE